MGKYEKATLKAHYELLKEHKQGLLVDADVVEEIDSTRILSLKLRPQCLP